eukprot:scaffold6514_cov21-Tisochrysis_lutea.AAC.5
MAVRTCGLAAAVMVEHALVVQVECDRPLRMREAAGLTARWVGGAWGEAEAEETPTASLAAQQVRHLSGAKLGADRRPLSANVILACCSSQDRINQASRSCCSLLLFVVA